MGLSRRLQSLIVESPFVGVKWLRRADLRRQLFNDTAMGSESAVLQDSTSQTLVADANQKSKHALAEALQMERIQISSPIFRFQAAAAQKRYAIDCFHLSDGKLVLADYCGRMFLCDADMRHMATMPNLQKPKLKPISLFVPSANADDHPNNAAGSLYVMESIPNPEKVGSMQPSNQFEVFEYHKPSRTYENPWHCRLLLPPPFVRDPALTPQKISSYAVVGSNICISTLCNDTYFLDTASDTWTEVGKGKLPFYGKVEYVPELKLWFGISSQAKHLAAADLSAMDYQPQLVGDWREFELPPEWLEYRDSQLVNLGLGKFCIARFLETMSMASDETIDRIVVFTGVEVMPAMHDGNCSGSGNGKVKLQMKRHKSRFHVCNGATIDAVF
ncbi:unnamed protein product [Urochloa decumbens]|uniref:Uncharacterized protein n=1 Tax=Urochloa decumbens TaxID=240449 RepID=A0ABC8V8A4_9POAL